LSDAGQEVRTSAKQAFGTLSNLLSKTNFESLTMKCLNEQKYNKVKELFEKGFSASMSDFNPTKQSFYRGKDNRSTRRNFRNGSNSSNGFGIDGIDNSPSKFKTSASVSKFSAHEGVSRSAVKPSPSAYSKRSSFKSNREYGSDDNTKHLANNTISVIHAHDNSQIQKIVPGKSIGKASYTDTEDNKTTKSTPKSVPKQRRISKRNIK
jgi:hypothetical protein